MDNNTLTLMAKHNDDEMMDLKRSTLTALSSLSLSDTTKEVAQSAETEIKIQEKSVQQTNLLSLPNELIDNILDNLQTTETLFAIGRKCHRLREFINNESERLSTRIIKREHARLSNSFPSNSTDMRGPGFHDLTVLEALRKGTLYYGRRRYYWTAETIHVLAIWYERDQEIFDGEAATGRCDMSFLEEMLEYLLHLDTAAHPYHRKVDGWKTLRKCKSTNSVYCQCERCTSLLCCGPEGAHRDIGVAVWKFELSGWDMDHPSRFFKERASEPAKKWIDEKRWLDMVKDVLENPIQQYTKAESGAGSLVLSQAIWAASGCINSWYSSSVDHFIKNTGLPSLEKSSEKWDCVYFPRMETSKRQEMVADYERVVTRGTNQLWKSTRAVQAAQEYCVRLHDEHPEAQLLDPKNVLLRAAVFEELLVTARLG